jgi:hypothetical protein
MAVASVAACNTRRRLVPEDGNINMYNIDVCTRSTGRSDSRFHYKSAASFAPQLPIIQAKLISTPQEGSMVAAHVRRFFCSLFRLIKPS